MVEVRFTKESTSAPERVLSAATDFSDRRLELWPTIDPKVYRVHEVGADWADVTEGSAVMGGVWARERYSWSEPGRVRAQVQESNVFRPGSSWELRVGPGRDGGSTIECVSRRLGKGPRGRLMALMLRLAGRKILAASLARTLSILEQTPAGAPVGERAGA